MTTVIHNPSEVDWARLAAYIDGEGSIFILNRLEHKTQRRSTSLVVCVSNTDVRLVQWIQCTFGGAISAHNKLSNPKWNQVFEWKSLARRGADILRGCMPFLIIKREQAEIAIAHDELVHRVREARHPKQRAQAWLETQPKRNELRIQLSHMKARSVAVENAARRVN